MSEYDAIIIGGGVAGLACAAFLANSGKKVQLLEKNLELGGCLASAQGNGLEATMTTHRLCGCEPDGFAGQLFEKMGLKSADLKLERLNTEYQFLFPGNELRFDHDWDSFRQSLCEKFPQEQEGIESCFSEMRDLYEEVVRIPPRVNPAEWFMFPAKFPRVIKYSDKNYESLLSTSISSDELKAMVSGFCYAGGLGPADMSAMVMVMRQASQLRYSSFTCSEGMSHFINVMAEAVTDNSGDIQTGVPVSKIMVDQKRAVGVEAEGEIIRAKAVVSAMDAQTTLFSLVGRELLPRKLLSRLLKMKPSLSTVKCVYRVPDQSNLPGHDHESYIYDSYDVNDAFYKITGCYSPSVCRIRILPRTTSARRTITVESLIPGNIGEEFVPEWIEGMESRARRLVDTVSKSNRKVTISPGIIAEQTGNMDGAIFGWAHLPGQIGRRRLQPSTPIKGLFLAGHWTTPGGGVTSAMSSGCRVGKLVKEKIRG
jgi:prolycopene isomerase